VEIVAISEKGSSLPSETMLLWTDPALPAIVEVGALLLLRYQLTKVVIKDTNFKFYFTIILYQKSV
jgi:hypothetical protein